MTDKQKLDKFLKLQNKGISLEEIAIELDSEVKPLRRFLNKNGYKSVKGKYVKKDDGVENKATKQLEITIDTTNNTKKKRNSKKEPSKIDATDKKANSKTSNKKNTKVYKAKPAKVNVSAEDLDKLCEVYDWYLSVKDLKPLQPKVKKTKKDVIIEDINIKEVKATRIQVEKATWEDFERLCSNSEYSKQEIITQAIREFLKQYKNLI
ncbi:DNA-binding protein [Paraclostridium bifermentans]|uniref:DNA-binding protein n=1 Tax=Paraclostridium bifermentans TaxID=1490 RepID=UPI00359C77E4